MDASEECIVICHVKTFTAALATKSNMKVTIRKRKTSNEKSSLYLDFKEHGVRKKEALKLYVYCNPKTKTEHFENKKLYFVKKVGGLVTTVN